jgi:hypothetical protein
MEVLFKQTKQGLQFAENYLLSASTAAVKIMTVGHLRKICIPDANAEWRV